jgi:hypothetical protein
MVEVVQLGGAGEADHRARSSLAHADEQEDDARGSKRRRLIEMLSTSVQASAGLVSRTHSSITITRSNVTRPVASNGKRMVMSDSNGGFMNTDDDDPRLRGKKHRSG